MKRSVLGVVVGYIAWTALWLGGNALIFNETAERVAGGETITETGTLMGLIVMSVVCSMVAGYLTARIGRERIMLAVFALGGLLLFTGIVVQIEVWEAMPVWYHLTFLTLLIPASLLGRMVAPRKSGVTR